MSATSTRARRGYDRLSPADGWSPPPSLSLHMYALRVYLAARLGVLDDIAPLLAALDRYRGLHAGTGGGLVAYEGAVELWLGVGAAALGRWDDADRDLAARGRCRPRLGYAELRRPRRRGAGRGAAGPRGRRATSPTPGRCASRLGRWPSAWRCRSSWAVSTPLMRRAAEAGPLSPRELEIAALLTEGRTNREMAADLFLSERTAQNHVQHILTKLGLTNRTQVAAWYRRRPPGSA